ncbi:MAG: tetratricopeptide repeat protein [Acidobacteria bacterium]|nr:tetratricopeptide repeat protein [Acidobacteriota bacterium]
MKSWLFAKGVCLLPLLVFIQISFAAQAANERNSTIITALQSGEFDQALELLQSALRESPNNPQLWMFQGLAFSGKHDSQSALASYKHALKASPDYLPALEGAAQIQYQAGNADAIPLLEHVLKIRPDDVTTHAMLAVLSEKKGDCSTAVQHFSRATPAVESNPDALQGYGFCLLKLKQTEDAIRVFKELLSSRPDDVRSRRALATAQLSADKPQDALATMQPLLTSDADVETMRLGSAIYEANKDTPAAVKILRDAIVKDPSHTSLYVDFAELAMDHQSFQAGVEMVDAGIKLHPDAQLYMARGVLYVQLADYEKAEIDFEEAEKLDPSLGMSAAAQGMLANERNQNDPAQALASVRAKLVKKPNDAFLLYLQGAILSKMGADPGSTDFKKGLESTQRAVKLQPSLTAAHNLLAKFYLDAGENALAVKECRIVLQQTPSDQSALYHLVIALRKSGNQAEIPDLLKRLAKARQEATKQEGERNRYKLVVASESQSK